MRSKVKQLKMICHHNNIVNLILIQIKLPLKMHNFLIIFSWTSSHFSGDGKKISKPAVVRWVKKNASWRCLLVKYSTTMFAQCYTKYNNFWINLFTLSVSLFEVTTVCLKAVILYYNPHFNLPKAECLIFKTSCLPCHNICKPLLGANKPPTEKQQAEAKVHRYPAACFQLSERQDSLMTCCIPS